MGGALSSWANTVKITPKIQHPGDSPHGPHHPTGPLTPEIARTIFSYLDANERLRITQVCPAWAAIADETCMWTDDEVRLRLSTNNTPSLSVLHQRGISMAKVEKIEAPYATLPRLLQALPDATSLNLSHGKWFMDELIRKAFSGRMWTSLRVLNLSWCPLLGDMTMDCVASTLPNLEELYISGSFRITNTSMAFVASRLRKLKLIEMNKCRIGNDGLRQLSGLSITGQPLDEEALPALECIRIQSTPFVNYTGILFIRHRMRYLATLDIAACASVDDWAVHQIAGIATLKHLDLRKCKKLTARSIEFLSTGLLSLTYLDVSSCPCIGDDAMEKLVDGEGLAALTTLHLGSTAVTDYGLTLAALFLKCLRSLDVSCCVAISKRGVEAVTANLEDLRCIYLAFCKKLENDALMHLSNMANLQVLSLKGCPEIGSLGMEIFASGKAMGNFLELDVSFTSVDDIALKYIARVIASPLLNVLYIRNYLNMKFTWRCKCSRHSCEKQGIE